MRNRIRLRGLRWIWGRNTVAIALGQWPESARTPFPSFDNWNPNVCNVHLNELRDDGRNTWVLFDQVTREVDIGFDMFRMPGCIGTGSAFNVKDKCGTAKCTIP